MCFREGKRTGWAGFYRMGEEDRIFRILRDDQDGRNKGIKQDGQDRR